MSRRRNGRRPWWHWAVFAMVALAPFWLPIPGAFKALVVGGLVYTFVWR